MRSTVALLLAVLAAMIVPAGAAHAGTYDVWGCRTPDGQRPAPIAGWTPISVGAPPPSNLCGSWQGMRAAFQVSGLSPSAVTGWSFSAPPSTTIAAYELYRSARVGAASDGSARAFALYHDEPRFEPTVHLFEFCTPQPQNCHVVGDPQATDPLDPDNRVMRSGLRIKRLLLRMECRSINGPVACAPADPSGGLTIGRSRISLNDAAAPALGKPTGALVAPGAILDGAQAVTVSASDVGGGVERFEVVVDGRPMASEPVGDRYPSCRVPFVALIPCPAAVTRSFAFNTSAVGNGEHAVQIAAIDAAGNRTSSAPVSLRIANGARPNGRGASRRARVVARFESKRRRVGRDRARVRFGGTRAILGRLLDERGAPIPDARVDVFATNRHTGARQVHEGVVTTRADGRFRYLPPPGPSRRFELAYRAFSLDPDPSATATVTLGVRAGVRLDVRPRRTTSRGTIRFRGRLRGDPSRGGVQVTLYAVGRSVRSRVPVAVLTTDAAGRFGFRYRFLRTFAPFTYRFVAQVQRQRGYPYDAASSPPVTVRVVR